MHAIQSVGCNPWPRADIAPGSLRRRPFELPKNSSLSILQYERERRWGWEIPRLFETNPNRVNVSRESERHYAHPKKISAPE